jgi:hypothetical protein
MTPLRDELARAIARARFDKKEWTGACSKNERTEYLVNTYWRNDLPESDAILPIITREIAAARKAAFEEAAGMCDEHCEYLIAAAIRKLGEK